MKKKLILPLLFAVLLSGCGNQADNWQNVTEFGDIDIDASVVDTNDVEDEYDIDKYLNIVELNTTPLDMLNIDTFAIPYNLIAEQVGLSYIASYSIEPTEKNTMLVYKQLGDYYGIELYANKDNKIINGAFSQVLIDGDYGTDEYYQAISRCMAAIIGAVPNLKKYDINKIYFEIAENMKESGGKYSTSYNRISIDISRSYNWVTINIKIPQ